MAACPARALARAAALRQSGRVLLTASRPVSGACPASTRLWQQSPVPFRQFSSAAGGDSSGSAHAQSRQRWDITEKRWVEFIYEPEDYARFPKERALFRADPRLRPGTLAPPPAGAEMDWLFVLKGFASVVRAADLFTEPFQDLCMERLAEQRELMELFKIPPLEDEDIAKPLHSKAVPGEGTYLRVRMQAYWLALHVWLLHSKQHLVQENEGLFGSALCALLTRRIFEWQWTRLRLWLYAADVPAMSVSNELQDLQEFVFGLCVALDDAFREEAPEGTLRGLALEEQQLRPGQLGLAPRVKYVLWANVYSGAIPHDAPHLHELTVYLLRQRAALETLPRDAFFTARFHWDNFPREVPTA